MNYYEKKNAIYKNNLNLGGEYNLIEIKLIEEMSELIQAILKCDADDKHVLEEFVDVNIMLHQYERYLDEEIYGGNLDEEFDKVKELKINRTAERLGFTND